MFKALQYKPWLIRTVPPYTKFIHYSQKFKEHVDIMIFIERYPLKRCQGCVKLIASKVNCFLNITDLSEVQLCMSSNSWTWECPHTKDGADHVPLIFLSSVYCITHLFDCMFLCTMSRNKCKIKLNWTKFKLYFFPMFSLVYRIFFSRFRIFLYIVPCLQIFANF